VSVWGHHLRVVAPHIHASFFAFDRLGRPPEALLKNWLVMFKPDTYEVVKDKGIIGVLYQHRKRFGQLSEGDRFVAYVSRDRVVDGYGTLTSDPYEDVTPVWATFERYPERCQVSFEQAGARKDAKELLWHLECWPDPMKTSPSNYLFCKGGFLEISDDDYELLVGVLHGAPPPTNAT